MAWLSGFFSGANSLASALSADQQQALATWRQLPGADLSVLHSHARYVVVDVETSGLNMKKDRLISIGAVALVDGRLDLSDAFQIVLRQETVSTHENILIHGIGGSAQSDGIDPPEALLQFLHYVGSAPLVAYHAFFDQAMLDKAMLHYLGHKPKLTWIDLAWVLPEYFRLPSGSQMPLDYWLQRFDIENILRHNAVSDAYATAKLLQVAIAAGERRGAPSAASFLEIERSRRWMYENR